MKKKILALLSASNLEPFVADAVATLIDREFIVKERPKRYRVTRVEGPGYDRYGDPRYYELRYGYRRPPRLKWYFFDLHKLRPGGYPPVDAIFHDYDMARSFWNTLPADQRDPFPEAKD